MSISRRRAAAIILAVFAAAGCSHEKHTVEGSVFEMPRFSQKAWAGTEGTPVTKPAASVLEHTFEQTLASIEMKRGAFCARWSEADTDEERDAIREEARAFVTAAIVERIFPAWMGTPWTMCAVKDGLKPDALYPGQEGKGVSCSYFIASVLTNAGLKLESRSAFAGAIALHIQRSLAPDEEDLHRYWNITPVKLEEKLVALGEGLYIVGLNCHVGFIVVRDGEARFVHSSYVEPFEVVDERLKESVAIANSVKSGYVVTTLFRDDRLIEHWLVGEEVPFQKP